MAPALSSLFAVSCRIFAYVAVICEGIEPLVNFEDQVSAFSSVSAVGAAVRDVQFTPETAVTISAFS